MNETSFVAEAWAAVGQVAQLSVGFVFALAFAAKVRTPHRFALTVGDFDLVPRSLALPAAMLILGSEATVAFAFVTGYMFSIAAPLALFVLIVFLIGVSVNLARGRRIACGCFGNDETTSAFSIGRLLLLMTAVAISLSVGSGPSGSGAPPLALTDVATGRVRLGQLVATAVLALFVICVGAWAARIVDIARLLRQRPASTAVLVPADDKYS